MSRSKSSASTTSHVTEHPESFTSSLSSAASELPQAHRDWTALRGPVLFTGPSGLRDHRVNTQCEFQQVGENEKSVEVTSHISYLNRAAPGEAFPKAKHGQVGEIGWVYDTLHLVKGI